MKRPNRLDLAQDLTFEDDAGDEKKKPRRKFAMVAYTGAVVDRFWGAMVIDLAGLEVPKDGVPIYRGHDSGLFIGRSESLKNDGKKLEVRGFLFDGIECAEEVKRISDQGGRWQASVGIDLDWDAVDEIGAASSVEVNGREIPGPVSVFRKTFLREVSFVPLGADKATSAVALSDTTKKRADRPKETTMDPVIAERQRVKQIREAFPKHRDFADQQIDKGASLAEAKAAFAEIAMAELAEKEKEHEAKLAAEKTAREEAEKKLAEAKAQLAKPSFAALLGAPTGGTTSGEGDPAGGETDPIRRWDALLAAEIDVVRTKHMDEVRELAARRGISLSEDAHARALAVSRLSQREPKLREAYVAAFNASGIGSRVRNNKAR